LDADGVNFTLLSDYRLSEDHARDGGIEDFSGENQFAGAAGTAAEERRGFAENDDIFDLGGIHGFGKDEGAEFDFRHLLHLKTAALGLGEIEASNFRHHLLDFGMNLIGNCAAVDAHNFGAGQRQLDAEEIIEIAVWLKADRSSYDQHILPLRGAFDQGV
jgi:hypothetical protein